MKNHSRCKVARRFLLFWCLFIGVGAVAGAVGMLSSPDGSALGMDAMLPYFQVLPFSDRLFQDFTFSGIALLIVNGLTNLTAAGFLLAKKKAGLVLGGIFGVTLMAWICIQFVIFPLNFMSTAYFIFGLAQALTGYAAVVFYRQEHFSFREEDYRQVGTNPKELVVYFSRMGYTRKIAYETAQRSGACVYEIHAAEPTEGTKGFWWCGRFGMHGWAMPIEPVAADLSAYEKITICSPIWVFRLCGPVRAFCKEASGKVKRADYVLLHHMNRPFREASEEMDQLLGIKHEGFVSVCCRTGRYGKEIKEAAPQPETV